MSGMSTTISRIGLSLLGFEPSPLVPLPASREGDRGRVKYHFSISLSFSPNVSYDEVMTCSPGSSLPALRRISYSACPALYFALPPPHRGSTTYTQLPPVCWKKPPRFRIRASVGVLNFKRIWMVCPRLMFRGTSDLKSISTWKARRSLLCISCLHISRMTCR